MEIAFDAIGIEIKNESAFNDLAEDVGNRFCETKQKRREARRR